MPNGNRVVKSSTRRAWSMSSMMILTFHCLPSAFVCASIRCPGCAEPAGVMARVCYPTIGHSSWVGRANPYAPRGCAHSRNGTLRNATAGCFCGLVPSEPCRLPRRNSTDVIRAHHPFVGTGDFYKLTGAFALSELPTIHELGLVVISYARRLCTIDA